MYNQPHINLVLLIPRNHKTANHYKSTFNSLGRLRDNVYTFMLHYVCILIGFYFVLLISNIRCSKMQSIVLLEDMLINLAFRLMSSAVLISCSCHKKVDALKLSLPNILHRTP